MNLNLKQLETFLCIVRLGGFAAAAEHLHATQSAISVRIQELEHAFGVTLLGRGHRRIYLTPQGRALLPLAERLLGLASQTYQEVGDLGALRGVVRLGVSEVVALTWLPEWIAACRERYPKVSFEIDRDLSTGLKEKLTRGEVDLALVAGPVVDVSLTTQSLGYADFCWVASPRFPASGGPYTPQKIKDLPLISLSQHPYEYPAIERWLSDTPDHDFVISCNNIGVIIELVVKGIGVSLLPEVCCRLQIDAGKLRILNTSPAVPAVEFIAAWRKTSYQPLITSIGSLASEVSEFAKHSGRRRGKALSATGQNVS